MTSADNASHAGQAVYSKRTLSIYDLLVLGISNHLIWRCPTRRLLAMYDEHISASHLDIGVGTGYFLDRCRMPDDPRIMLVDLNENSLEATAKRIARYKPQVKKRDVLEPLDLSAERFDSIGMNYLLHCLPGDIRSKAVVFDHAAEYLNPGGILFGSTLLHDGVERSFLARRLMGFYNRKQIFSNTQDTLTGLREALSKRFDDFHVETYGCVATFYVRCRS